MGSTLIMYGSTNLQQKAEVVFKSLLMSHILTIMLPAFNLQFSVSYDNKIDGCLVFYLYAQSGTIAVITNNLPLPPPVAATVLFGQVAAVLRCFQISPLTLIYFDQTGLGDCFDCESTNRDGFGEFYLFVCLFIFQFE